MRYTFLVMILIGLIACEKDKTKQEELSKLFDLMGEKKSDFTKAVVIIPLENACSSCSQMTIIKLPRIEENYKSSIHLIFTARSRKLIEETLINADLEGFRIQKDPNYEAWKMGMVDNNPYYYFLKDGKLIASGGITIENVDEELQKITKYLEEKK